EAAEWMIRRPGRDRVRLAAALDDIAQRLLPRLLEADPELGSYEPDICAHQATEKDVAHAVVDDVGPLDPRLLHEHTAEPEPRGDRSDLARVVRLDAADRDERVAPLGQGVGDEVLELSRLVATEREAGVAV